LFPVVLACLLLGVWLGSRVPDWIYWKAAVVFLIAAELACGVVLALVVPGTLVLGFQFFRGQQTNARRAALARPLALCVSVLLALVAAEAASAIWQSRAHRFSAMPIGGFGRGTGSPVSPFRTPVADFNLPTDFPDPVGDRDIDLVILGESSAEGVPFTNGLSIGGILAWKMSEAMPARRIRSTALARSGDTLEWQHRELTKLWRRPDLLVLYCGHNEFTSRLPDSRNLAHYDDEKLPTAWDILVDRMQQTSSLAGLIHETAQRYRIAIPSAAHGQRRLVDVPCYTLTEYNTLLVDFRRRLETIVAYATRVGALPVLILPAANDAGFEPNRSILPARTSRSQRESFRRDFLAARRLETADTAAAIKSYQALLALQPGFAETHYRLARLREQTGEWDEAYRHDVASRDRDGYPMRLMSDFQQVYRDVASRHDCILIDSQSYFHAIDRHGLLGDELFQDAMHPSLRGQIALAQAVLQALRARRAFGWPPDSPVPDVDPAECAAHFGLQPGGWRDVCLRVLQFNYLAAPLRYDPGRRLQARDAYAAAADRIAAGADPEALGLPNIGIPAPVPILPATDARAHPPAHPEPRVRHARKKAPDP
jgi:hypothetical protein